VTCLDATVIYLETEFSCNRFLFRRCGW